MTSLQLLLQLAMFAASGPLAFSEGVCGDGWITLTDTCSTGGEDECVKISQPIKFVSWHHLQYVCDMQGGHLPEITDANKGKLRTILESYGQLYGTTRMFVGATTITRTDDWKWMSSNHALQGDNSLPTDGNKDCLVQQSGSTAFESVNCENDLDPTQIALVCMKKKASGAQAEDTVATDNTVETAAPAAGECEEGWTTFQDACYKFGEYLYSFENAKANCEDEMNAQLTTASSKQEDDFLATMAKAKGKDSIWLFAERPNPSSPELVWLDNTPWEYHGEWPESWYSGPRNRMNANCVAKNINRVTWVMRRCVSGAYFICKKKLA